MPFRQVVTGPSGNDSWRVVGAGRFSYLNNSVDCMRCAAPAYRRLYRSRERELQFGRPANGIIPSAKTTVELYDAAAEIGASRRFSRFTANIGDSHQFYAQASHYYKTSMHVTATPKQFNYINPPNSDETTGTYYADHAGPCSRIRRRRQVMPNGLKLPPAAPPPNRALNPQNPYAAAGQIKAQVLLFAASNRPREDDTCFHTLRGTIGPWSVVAGFD